MRYCENCGKSELTAETPVVPVCIDGKAGDPATGMDTELCEECIPVVEREMRVERLED